MTAIFEKTFDRTLDRLIADYASEAWRGAELEAWLFEDEAARRAAGKRFAAAGVTARLYSAYKPLVHFFTEEAEAGASRIAITYPVSPAAPGQRFLLEAYPLAGMVGAAEIAFTPAEAGGALGVEGGAVERRDAGGILASVLEHEEAVCHFERGVVAGVEADESAHGGRGLLGEGEVYGARPPRLGAALAALYLTGAKRPVKA